MLISNWKDVLKGAWSMWMLYASLILTVVEGVFPGLKEPLGLDDVTFSAVNGFIVASAILARVLTQSGITKEPTDPSQE